MLLLLSLRPSPSLPLRRLLRCRCSSASATPSSPLAPYHHSFARRMALAGIHPHHRVAVGVSGGPDSMALCVLAAAWKKAEEGVSGTKAGEEGAAASGFVDGLLGVVVDHGLRPESAEEAQLVRDRVHGMGVMCEIARCQWPDGRPKQGHLQEAAREMRYQKLLDICIKQQIGILLIAHHSDDQAELFVLRLSRNSGVLGLAGTAFVSQLFAPNLKYDGENFSRYGILLVRPMLEFSKDDMYKICQGSNHLWVEDPTNNSMLYARNRIRASLRSLSTEGTFQSELHKLIYACRLTRACTDNACSLVLKQSVTVMEYGYIVIDLEKLDPRNVDDLCLSQFLAYVLQFISQRHRPIRGRSVRLLMDYIRSIPCKAALTVAGCYLCAAPRSKGTKILVCCSVDSMESSSVEMSYKCSYEEQPPPVPDIDQIVLEARLYSNQFLEKCSSIPFVSSKSSSDVLNKAKDLSLIDDFTLEKLYYLRTEEHQKFTTTKEDKHEEQYLDKTSSPDTILSLWLGETCHFMSRFLIMWKPSEFAVNGICFHDSQKHLCRYCIVNQDGSLAVRHMFDTDWLFLAEVSKIHLVEEGTNGSKVSRNKLEDDKLLPHTRYLQLSAMKALEILRSIPAPARRTLPVLINSQGDILSIPILEVVRLEGQPLTHDEALVSRDIHLLQLCTGIDEKSVGSSFQLVFAPIDDFPDDALLISSSFRVVPLDTKTLVISWHMKAATMCEFIRQEFVGRLQSIGREEDGMRVVVVENLKNPYENNLGGINRRFKLTLNKLYAWSLVVVVDYDCVVMIDSDNIFLQNTNELFQCGQFCAVFINPCYFHTGLFVLQPSMDVFKGMLHDLEIGRDSSDGADQGFLVGCYPDLLDKPMFHPPENGTKLNGTYRLSSRLSDGRIVLLSQAALACSMRAKQRDHIPQCPLV